MQPLGVDLRIERAWAAAGLSVLAIFALALLLGRQGVDGLGLFCPFRALVDLPCPVCGITRVFLLLSEGALWSAVSLAPLPALVVLGTLARAAVAGLRLGGVALRPGPTLPTAWWAAGAALLWGYAIWRAALTGAP